MFDLKKEKMLSDFLYELFWYILRVELDKKGTLNGVVGGQVTGALVYNLQQYTNEAEKFIISNNPMSSTTILIA